MAYLPLYRKYRPKNLQEIVGQEHIKHALSSAIELGKISHAYLFTGPRGTGKTSTARILAKSLNCQKGITLVPCEECPSCLDIKNSNPIDVIEIDAASNRSVEDARNILEKIQYVPVNGRFKIYIIDEVHMLTKEAFNTLLKTLEEPPENVIFILATTEIQKVLDTIVSRCQRFDFRRISNEDIFNHLKSISEKENIDIEDEALRTIAKTSSGGMRDALALLDQISVLDKKITTADVNSLLGRLSFETLEELFEQIENSSPQGAIEVVEKIYNSGNEPVQILTNLASYLKNLLICKNTDNKELLIELTQLSEGQIKTLKKREIENHQLTFLIERTSYYIKELKTSINQQLWLEVAIIDLANLTENTSLLSLQERLTRLESGSVPQPKFTEIKPVQPTVQPPIQPIVKKVEEEKRSEDIDEEPEAMPISKSAPVSDLRNMWLKLLQNISSPPTVSLLNQHCVPVEISDKKIVIACKESFLKLVSSDSKKTAIEEGAKKIFNSSTEVVVRAISPEDIAEKKNEKPVVETKIPVEKKEEEISDEDEHSEYIEKQKQEKMQKEIIANSDQVSMVVKLFNGKMID